MLARSTYVPVTNNCIYFIGEYEATVTRNIYGNLVVSDLKFNGMPEDARIEIKALIKNNRFWSNTEIISFGNILKD